MLYDVSNIENVYDRKIVIYIIILSLLSTSEKAEQRVFSNVP